MLSFFNMNITSRALGKETTAKQAGVNMMSAVQIVSILLYFTWTLARPFDVSKLLYLRCIDLRTKKFTHRIAPFFIKGG